MSGKRKPMDNNYVPKDYEDLYLYYIVGKTGDSLCKMLLRNFLPYSTQEEKESLLHDVFLRCMQKKILEIFDPAKANFGGAIYFVTRSVVANMLDRRQRDPVTGLKAGTLTDEPEENFEPGSYALNLLFQVDPPNYAARIDAKHLVEKLYSFAREKFEKPQHKRDRSLLPLLKLLMDQHNPDECGKCLGVTPSTIYNWVGVLREEATRLKTAS